MRTITLFTIALLLLFIQPCMAQFPTAIGTKWEYFQYDQDIANRNAIIPGFEDEVMADTTIGTQTYQKVVRTGKLRFHFSYLPPYDADTLDGTWFYRVAGDSVWAIDSIVSGQAYESILYDFSLNIGDT